MPFNVWCDGCGHLIGKGVRFNAEKQEIGKYHSTKIWSFTMTAPCCQQRIEVQTDPKNAQYNVVSGGKQKVSCCSAYPYLDLLGRSLVTVPDATLRTLASLFPPSSLHSAVVLYIAYI